MDIEECKASTSETLSERMGALDLSPSDLAAIMKKHGDHRSSANILKGLRRMLSGETAVAGEIIVILGLIEQLKQAGADFFPQLHWTEIKLEAYEAGFNKWSAKVERVRRCWRVSITDPSGVTLPWKAYSHLTVLERAQRTAEQRLWSAMNFIDVD